MQLSRQLLALALLFALVLATLPSFSVGQEEEVDGARISDVADEYEEETEEIVEPMQQYVLPAQDVQTYVKFLGVEENKFQAGEEVTALIGLVNSGPKTYNVSYVGAHLHSPYDFNFYIQNFTVRWTSSLLPAHSEVTVEYKFRPDDKLEPLDFHLSGWMIYNDTSSPPIMYRSVFFNQTIEVAEKGGSGWSIRSLLTTLLVLGALAAGAYVFLSQTTVGKKAAKRATAAAHSTQEKPAAWEATVYKPKAQQKAAGAKQTKKTQQ